MEKICKVLKSPQGFWRMLFKKKSSNLMGKYVTNGEIVRRTGIHINDEVRKTKWKWLGHVFRMHTRRHTHAELKWKPFCQKLSRLGKPQGNLETINKKRDSRGGWILEWLEMALPGQVWIAEDCRYLCFTTSEEWGAWVAYDMKRSPNSHRSVMMNSAVIIPFDIADSLNIY